MKRKIYVVEDNVEIRKMLGYVLSDTKHQFTGFGNISDFKLEMESSLPDLILLDIMLPDGDGVTLCCELKANPATQNIPVVLMSAHANPQLIADAHCANAFISKPFDIHQLMNTIEAQWTL